MNTMARTIFNGLPIWLVLGGCSMGFVPIGLTPVKAYGQHWVKPGMSVEGWRQDWVRCGGMNNGQYSGNALTGATTKTILASQEQEREKLDACMKSKGYEYRNTGP